MFLFCLTDTNLLPSQNASIFLPFAKIYTPLPLIILSEKKPSYLSPFKNRRIPFPSIMPFSKLSSYSSPVQSNNLPLPQNLLSLNSLLYLPTCGIFKIPIPLIQLPLLQTSLFSCLISKD